ncbi:MAG TPA: hypothetical protein VHX59_02455 [Mycobacteriales bacterium]|nr:hypothetical protein [Mycobacteriales bacterium]
MKSISRWLAAAGLVAVAVGVVLFLWPLRGAGLSGNALWPHYGVFGWATYAPMPAHPTLDDLRHAGITVPQDTVRARRRTAGIVTAAGVAVVVIALIAIYRPWTALARRRTATRTSK